MGAGHILQNGDSKSNGHDPGNGQDHDAEDDNVIRMPTLAERDRQRREDSRKRKKQRPPHEPIINLPPVTKALVVAILGIHIALFLSSMFPGLGLHYQLVGNLGFIPGRFTGTMPFIWVNMFSPIAYMFLHGSWLHVILNTVMLMAFGTGFERWQGPRAFLLYYFLCGLGGIALHMLIYPFSQTPVIGASAGISGLFAAVLVMLHRMSNMAGVGGMSIWPFVILWIGISVMFGMMGGPAGGAVAWAAHVGGFLTGFAALKFVFRIL